MKTQFLALFAAGAMMLGLGGAMNTSSAEANHQQGGAAGLIAAVVQVQDVQVVDVVDVTFRDINVIRNVLNNSEFLNNNDIDVEVLTVGDILSDNDIDVVLVGNEIVTIDNVAVNVEIDDIVAIVQVLGGGFVVLT